MQASCRRIDLKVVWWVFMKSVYQKVSNHSCNVWKPLHVMRYWLLGAALRAKQLADNSWLSLNQWTSLQCLQNVSLESVSVLQGWRLISIYAMNLKQSGSLLWLSWFLFELEFATIAAVDWLCLPHCCFREQRPCKERRFNTFPKIKCSENANF